jgi:hypothetical protein
MNTETKNIHDYLDLIFTAISDDNNEFKFNEHLENLKEELQVVSEFLDCTAEESLVFCGVLLGTIHSEGITIEKLKRNLGFRAIEVFKLEKIKDELLNKGLIEQERRRGRFNQIFVEDEVYSHISKGEKPQMKSYTYNEDSLFFEELSNLFEKKGDEDMTTQQLIQKISKIEAANPDLPVFKIKNKIHEDWPEFIFFLFVCKEYAGGDDEVDFQHVLKRLFEKVSVQIDLKRRYQRNRSIYMLEDYLEIKEGSFRSSGSIKLTDKAITEIFEDDKREVKSEFIPLYSTLVKCDKIEPKQLHFEGKLKENLEMIKSAIRPERFDEIKKAFSLKGMKESVTGIYYGHPGTGKTESIYQMARETGRSVIMVDIANIRDKYVGESEKRLKAVFNNYKKACDSFEATPILLFNEADALFGKRINVSDSVDQMNNAMQNILLQELEDFNGIFMATTNLAASLDPAFERRFLFKVRFDKPAPAVRARIWMEKFKGSITKATAEKLANEFEFSGGEIDNIAKKALVHEIVMNKKLSYAVLKDFCDHEFLQKSGRVNAVGFRSSLNTSRDNSIQ